MKYIFSVFAFFLLISCNSLPNLNEEFDCKVVSTNNTLKTHDDVRKMFSAQFPKNWKVNLYYDDAKTSIYAADTTVNLTATTLIDITLVHKTIFIDNTFKQKITDDNKKMQLSEVKTKAVNLLKKDSYYSYAKGKKNRLSYHILNTFTKVNSENFLHVKTEIYGDSLVEKRICNAIKLIEKIQLK